MSISERASGRWAQGRAELCKVLELTLRRRDLSTPELRAACAAAQGGSLLGVCVGSSRVLQAAAFLEESSVKVVCSIGADGGSMDADVKRFETEVAVDAGAHIIEVTPDLGRLRDGDYAAVLRELRDVVEAADERPVRVCLPLETLSFLDLEQVLAVVAESGAKGLGLSASNSAADLEAVKQCAAALGDGIHIKFETPSLTWNQVASLGNAGTILFGTTADAEILRGEG